MNRHYITYGMIILMLFAVIGLNADYYDSVINLTGQNLYTGLRNLIDTNTNSSYTGAKTQLFQNVDNNGNGTVTCVYTGKIYSINSSYNGGSDPNTEHTYAQSWFTSSSESIKKADIHHLFITTMTVNSSRGNLPLTNVANHSSGNTDVYFTNTPRQSYRGYSSNNVQVFEPADQFKGNIARALLYFNTRYSGQSLVRDGVDMLPVLLLWHNADPPDNAERARNTAVFNYQGNRNPFIDHPEFVARIWGGTANEDNIVLSIPELNITSVYPNPFKSSLSLSVQTKYSAPVSTTVYNLKGQRIYSSISALPAGENKLQWSGLDDSGKQTPAGMYIICVESEGKRATTKAIKQN